MFQPPSAPRTLQAAIRDVRSQRPAVRADAVRELVPHAGAARDQVIGALEAALCDDAEPAVRAAAATALADVMAADSLPKLLLAVEDDDPYVRQMAISALGEIGDARAAGRLRRALGDARPEIRFQAVIAFPRVCPRRDEAEAAILRASEDEDPMVCHIALRVSEELVSRDAEDGPGASTVAEDNTDTRTAGPIPIPPAMMARGRALLEHASPLVRAAAAVLLARGGDERGRAILVAAAGGDLRGADREDEAAAIELCGDLGLNEARAALERRAFGGLLGIGLDPLYWHARVALARMGHARATAEILRDLRARDRHRRTLAVAASGRAGIHAARPLIEAMRGDDDRADQDAVADALLALDATRLDA